MYDLYDLNVEKNFYYDLKGNINNFSIHEAVINANRYCIELRKIEYDYFELFENSNENFEKIFENQRSNIKLDIILKKFNNCYNQLMSSGLLYSIIETNDYLNELQDRIVFYYKLMNEKITFSKNKIKIINVNKHHRAVNYILENYKNDEIPTILTFDAHSDTNTPNGNCLGFNKINYTGKFEEKFSDIGSVHLPIFIKYKKNNGLFWIRDNSPYCYVRKQIGIRTDLNFATIKDIEILKVNNKKLFSDAISDNETGYDNLHEKTISWINEQKVISHVINNTKTNFIDLDPITYTETDIDNFKYYQEVTQRYILNVDLDYFCCNGSIKKEDIEEKINCNLVSENEDIISEDRVNIDLHNIKKDTKYKEQMKPLLMNEINSIRKKIDKFLIMIKKLKENNKIPEMIILCDSSEINFSLFENSMGNDTLNFENSTFTKANGFVPKYYSFWLKNTVIQNLRLILDEKFNFEN